MKDDIWVNIRDGRTALLTQRLKNDPSVTDLRADQYFYPNGSDLSLFMANFLWDYWARLLYSFTATDAEFNQRVAINDRPVHYALRCGSLRSVKIFFEHGNEFDKEIINNYVEQCENLEGKQGYISVGNTEFKVDSAAHIFYLNIKEFIVSTKSSSVVAVSFEEKLSAQKFHFDQEVAEIKSTLIAENMRLTKENNELKNENTRLKNEKSALENRQNAETMTIPLTNSTNLFKPS